MSKFRFLSDNVIKRVDCYPYIISKSIAEILEFWKQLNVVETSAVKIIIGTLPIQEGDCYTPRNSIYQVFKKNNEQLNYDIVISHYVRDSVWPELTLAKIEKHIDLYGINDFKLLPKDWMEAGLELSSLNLNDAPKWDCKGATITNTNSPVLVF